MHTGTNTYDVFLSHNSRDKSLIEPLAEELKAKGIKVWLDAWALVPGETWQDGLANGLEQSEAIVVAFGEQGVGNWQREEIQSALNEGASTGKRIIPLLLPGGPDINGLPAFLKSRTAVDARNGIDAAVLNRLIAGIRGEPPDGSRLPSDTPALSSAEVPASTVEQSGMNANVSGSGSVSQSQSGNAVSAGKGGIAIGGDVQGNITINNKEE